MTAKKEDDDDYCDYCDILQLNVNDFDSLFVNDFSSTPNHVKAYLSGRYQPTTRFFHLNFAFKLSSIINFSVLIWINQSTDRTRYIYFSDCMSGCNIG